MKQYLDLLKEIKEKGTHKPAAREGMPGTTSLFGYQFRHNLQDGFPLLTTKKMFWKGVVVELLWFLRGDTNIKYLVNNGVNIWNEDAYQYYLKICKQYNSEVKFSFDEFISWIKCDGARVVISRANYTLGDCGYQYGRVWRNWQKHTCGEYVFDEQTWAYYTTRIDQIKNVITSLKTNPEGRRHIVTAIDPAHDTDLALYWCHSMFQFNCRPLNWAERLYEFNKITGEKVNGNKGPEDCVRQFDEANIPKYYLDCQLYQRSADVFLGVPFNIASYALLTHILAKICNMIPGDFVHTFGDVHIYDNHMDAVNEQLTREPRKLPRLLLDEEMFTDGRTMDIEDFKIMVPSDFKIEDYDPHPAIKAELSTGMKK